MTTQKISLNDRFDLEKSPVLLNGTQALVRLTMMQAARDKTAGLNTAGYVTGYRGSPLGAVDLQMSRAEKLLARVLMPVNAHMDGREWLAGDFSIADPITGHACLVSSTGVWGGGAAPTAPLDPPLPVN